MGNGLVERLGWTLVHSVWEGTLVALVLAATLWLAKRDSARTRYTVACFAMAVLAAAPSVTFWLLTPVSASGASDITKAAGSSWTDGAAFLYGGDSFSELLPWLVRIWLVGVLILSLRLGGTLLHLERWRRHHTRPADQAWQERADGLARSLGVRRAVRLLVSDRINVPSAWGVLKTVIVLPTSLITHLPPAEVETILLHELAHVRRHDYLVNLVQAVVETVLFYHPAVWWVSAVVRREREHCCDDVVVAHSDPMPYARALLHLEERRLTLPRPTLSAKESNLMNRIARILTPKPAPRVSPLASTMAALGILGAILGGTLEAQAQAKPATKPKVEPKIVRRLPVKIKREPARLVPAKGKSVYSVKFVGDTARLVPVGGGKPIYMVTAPKANSSVTKAAISTSTTSVAAVGTKRAIAAPAVAFGQTTVNKSATLTGTSMEATAAKSSSEGQVVKATGTLSGGGFGGYGTNGTGEHGQTTVAVEGGMGIATLGGGGFGTSTNRSANINVSFDRSMNTVSVDVTDAPLKEVIQGLARKMKLSVVFEKGNYEDVTIILNDIPFEAALRTICKAAGATFRNEDEKILYILPRPN